MLRTLLLLFTVVGYVVGSPLPIRRLAHTGPARSLGLAKGRIYGGQDATSGQFPYQVSLQLDLLVRMHQCGAAIISASSLLTAAHCEYRYRYMAIAGELDLGSDEGTEQESEVSEQILHPDYTGETTSDPNDIAVFRLQDPFTLNSYVQTIGLAQAGSIPESGSSAVISGWGSNVHTATPDILQWAEVSIIDYQTCGQLLVDLDIENIVADTMVCTGPLYVHISTCTGDTGGPLVQDGVVVGVSQWFIRACARYGAPSGFTRVSAFSDFINQNM